MSILHHFKYELVSGRQSIRPVLHAPAAACSAVPQLVRAELDDAALLLRGCLSSPRAAAARLRPAVDQCVWARNRATSRRFQRRWRRKGAAALARSTAQRPPQHPHFRGPYLRLAVVAKVRHPAASPVPPIIERNRGTPELRRTPDSCGTARSLSFSRNHSLTAASTPLRTVVANLRVPATENCHRSVRRHWK